MIDRRSALLVACGAAGLAGCALLPRKAVVPLATLRFPSPCGIQRTGPAPALLVLLPGAYSLPTEFIDEGWLEPLRDRGVDADVLVVDSHLAYFSNGSILERLRLDVVGPARAQGYRQVWFAGISLGGYGALAYAAVHGNDPRHGIDGVVAVAPYLGGRQLIAEIAAAGGALPWASQQPPVTGDHVPSLAEGGASDDAGREVWRWIVAHRGQPRLPIYLGFGSEDRLAEGHRLMATLLPPERVFLAPGGHDWPPWRSVWLQWLDLGLLPLGAAASCRGGARAPA